MNAGPGKAPRWYARRIPSFVLRGMVWYGMAYLNRDAISTSKILGRIKPKHTSTHTQSMVAVHAVRETKTRYLPARFSAAQNQNTHLHTHRVWELWTLYAKRRRDIYQQDSRPQKNKTHVHTHTVTHDASPSTTSAAEKPPAASKYFETKRDRPFAVRLIQPLIAFGSKHKQTGHRRGRIKTKTTRNSRAIYCEGEQMCTTFTCTSKPSGL